MGLLVGTERGVHQKEVEVLRQMTPIVSHFFAEKAQHHLEDVVGQYGITRPYYVAAAAAAAATTSQNFIDESTSQIQVKVS